MGRAVPGRYANAVKRFLLAAGLAVLLSACGGDGMAKPPTPGPTPTRGSVSETDRAYIGAVCTAFNTYLTSFSNATQRDPQLFSDQAKLLKTAAPILETFAKDLGKAKPPKDMANYHDALVERVKTIATKAKGGMVVTTEELAGVSKGAPLPPGTVRDRLEEAAAGLPQCAQSGGTDALFGDTGE